MFVKRLDYITEFFLYLLAFGITFSNFVTELAVAIIILCFLIKIALQRRLRFLYGSLAVSLALFFLWIGVSSLRSSYPDESIKWLLRLLRYLFVYFALLDFFYMDARRIRRFFWALVIIGAVTFVNGIFQGIAGFSFLRHERTVNPVDHLRRISASFVHPNDFGAYIITVLPLSFAFLVRLDRPYQRVLLVLVCLLGLYCLFKTSSRSAWLGFFAGIVLFGAFYGKKIVYAIPVVMLALLLVMPQARERVGSLFSAEHGTVWERNQLWKGAFAMIKEHPIAGFGVNTFSRNFPKYKPPEYPDLRYVHNCYLQMWSEIGIVGLLSFLSTVVCVFFLVIRRRAAKRAAGFLGFILFALLAGYAAFLIQSAMDTNLYSLVLTFHFWVLSAYLVAVNKTIEEKRNA